MGDILLGPFRLRQRLARGGMGEVWSGTHALRGVPVAVKLVRAERLDPNTKRDFQLEVAAQARLDHPSVVYLFDHGQIDEHAAAQLGLPVGAPWLAMEKCSSTLGALAPSLNWAGLRKVVVPLLEALAHAHSRGVLHRDIKMANVLLSTSTDLRPGVKLADFGIAHALADDDEVTRSAGTPRYMAPEQVTGDWEQLGPWTDLYALGVLTWRLVMGRRPWAELSGSRLVLAMMHHELKWFEPRYDVPPALKSWILQATTKAPSKRYQLAADALADFLALPVDCLNGCWLSNVSKLSGTLIPDDLEVHAARRSSFVNPIDDPPRASETSIRMNAAGLGLLPMRQPEFMGRRIERRVLWDVLQQVAKSSKPAAVSLLGPPRVGRGRFQRWFSEAAEASGQAVCIWVECVPGRELGVQVLKALRGWFRVGSFAEDEAMEHLQSWLREGDFVPALERMLRSQQVEPNWLEVVGATLAALGHLRPVILQIRGAAGQESVAKLVNAVLSQPRAAVIAVVDAPVPGAEVVELGPLDDASMTRLADALVGLEPGVRARLVRRSSGSPGFLVQMLLHWSKAGLLVPQPHGFGFSGDLREVPPVLAVVADSRLRALANRFNDDVLASLEVAAVIGQSVPIELWETVDGAARASQRRTLLAELALRGLVEEEVGHFRFASVPFREAVLARIDDRPALHARCAEALADGDPLELGRHRMEAGQPIEALEPLRRGLYQRIQLHGGRAALAECALLAEAIQAVEGPRRIRWSAIHRELEASIYLDLGDLEQAEAAAREVVRVAQLLSDDALMARSWAHIGAVAGHRGRLTTRKEAYRRALDLGSTVPAEIQAAWWTSLGTAWLGLGDTAGWRDCLLEAAHRVSTQDGGRSAYRVGLAESVRAQLEGRIEDALESLSEAYASAAEAGTDRGRLAVLRARAHTLVSAGRGIEALRAFGAALELAVGARPSRAPTVLGNAVALHLELRETKEGLDLFLRHRFLLPPGRDGTRRQLPAHCAGLAVAAGQRDWRVADYHLERLRRHGAWQWAELHSNLVLCEATVRSALNADRPRFAEDVAKVALAGSRRGGERVERERIRKAVGLPIE